MPIYEFDCPACGHQFEQLVASMKSQQAPACPNCGAETRKRLSVFSAHSQPAVACGSDSPCCGAERARACPGGSCPMARN